jgi:hypothetical protein
LEKEQLQQSLERQLKLARAKAFLATEQRENKSKADAAWIAQQTTQIQQLHNSSSMDLVNARRDLHLSRVEMQRATTQRNVFFRRLFDQSQAARRMQLLVAVLTVQSKWRTRQLRAAKTQIDTKLAIIATLQGYVFAIGLENGMLRTEIIGLRLVGITASLCLRALRIDLAAVKREKDFEIGRRLNLATKLQSLRIIGILVLAAMRSLRVKLAGADALHGQHQMAAQRMRVVNTLLLASFRSVRLELAHERVRCLDYQQFFQRIRIVHHLVFLSMRSLRANLAVAEGEKAHEIELRTRSEANVEVLRDMCGFLESKLHSEKTLRMACQRVELNTRLACYILFGLLRATLQAKDLEIAERKRLEGNQLVLRGGILQLCLVVRMARLRILKHMAQLKIARASVVKLEAQLKAANDSIDTQKDCIENL